MHVAALYRYPVKGFNPEQCETLSVLSGGRIAGDRVLGVRFADAIPPDDAWGTKHEFVALVNTPGLACLRLQFDHKTSRLQITLHDKILVDETLSDDGRLNIAAAIQAYVLTLAVSPLSGHGERLPLRVVGDGVTPRYQDSQAGLTTLHSRESLAAVAAASGSSDLSEYRFRSNIAIAGVGAWEEQGWFNRKIRIGSVDFEAVSAKGRCLATHANPVSGERDLPIMQTLLKTFVREKPTFAIAMISSEGGTVHVGDEITVHA
jgi:uncharacterized protein YcbX